MRSLIFVVLISFISYGFSGSIPFRGCDEGNTVFSIKITPCNSIRVDGWETCVVQHGIQIAVDAVFMATFTSSRLEIKSTAVIDGQVIDLPDSGANPCRGAFIPGCPITAGRLYIFNRYFIIQEYFPTGLFEITFAIRDKKTKRVMGCAKIPLIIERNPQLNYENEV